MSFVPEICRTQDDYQSGSKHPHSKGSAINCRFCAYPILRGWLHLILKDHKCWAKIHSACTRLKLAKRC